MKGILEVNLPAGVKGREGIRMQEGAQMCCVSKASRRPSNGVACCLDLTRRRSDSPGICEIKNYAEDFRG